jgi:hypothetical protein
MVWMNPDTCRGDHSGAEALDDAEDHQPGRRGGCATGRARSSEDAKSAREDGPAAARVAEAASRHQGHPEAERVPGDDPLDRARSCAQAGSDGR